MLRTLGHDLYGFLMNLDTLHDHLSVTYTQMAAPSFRCEKTLTTITLHYYSQRAGLSSIVQGIVKAVAEDFFALDIHIEEMQHEVTTQALAHHYIFSIECTDSPKNSGNYLERKFSVCVHVYVYYYCVCICVALRGDLRLGLLPLPKRKNPFFLKKSNFYSP